jgi:hypothetical protein
VQNRIGGALMQQMMMGMSAFPGSYGEPGYRPKEGLPQLTGEAAQAVLQHLVKGVTSPIEKTMGPMYGKNAPNYEDVLMATMMGVGMGWPGRGKGPNELGQISAFHGSPYKFDKFSAEKIGTGQGAQTFGHGLYFASEKDVAKHYAPKNQYSDINVEKSEVFGVPDLYNWKILATNQWGDRKILRTFTDEKSALAEAKRLEKQEPNVYSVTLHKGKQPGEYDYLKWDEGVPKETENKILTQARKELKGKRLENLENDFGAWPNEESGFRIGGEDIYRELEHILGSDREASAFLLRAGIDGIEYPAGSLGMGGWQVVRRSDKDAAYVHDKVKSQVVKEFVGKNAYEEAQEFVRQNQPKNYVVFDENAITIEK